MFNEHGYPHMKTTREWSALITTSFWKVSFLVVDGDAWSIFRTCFCWLYLFGEKPEFCAPFFFAAPEYQVQYSTGCRLCVLKRSQTSWNILTWVRNKESSNVRYLRSLWTREISLCSCCWLGSSDLASLSSFIFTDLDVEGSGYHAHGRVHWRGSTPGESFWTLLISEPWSFYSRKNGQWPSWPLNK